MKPMLWMLLPVCEMALWTSRGMLDERSTSAYVINHTCVITKAIKIGSSDSTDSFTPRRFIPINTATTRMHTQNLYSSDEGGRKLKIASAPLAIDIEIVST